MKLSLSISSRNHDTLNVMIKKMPSSVKLVWNSIFFIWEIRLWVKEIQSIQEIEQSKFNFVDITHKFILFSKSKAIHFKSTIANSGTFNQNRSIRNQLFFMCNRYFSPVTQLITKLNFPLHFLPIWKKSSKTKDSRGKLRQKVLFTSSNLYIYPNNPQ